MGGEVGMALTLDANMRRRIDSGPQPYFTNAEGLRGLEEGLRTGMPVVSVFKYNGNTLMMAAQGDGTSANGNAFRHITDTFAPLPPVVAYQNDAIYSYLYDQTAGFDVKSSNTLYYSEMFPDDKKEVD